MRNSVSPHEHPAKLADARACGRERHETAAFVLPCVIALWVPLYNFEPPALFGMPFFYWFQLLMIPLSAVAIFAADRIGKT